MKRVTRAGRHAADLNSDGARFEYGPTYTLAVLAKNLRKGGTHSSCHRRLEPATLYKATLTDISSEYIYIYLLNIVLSLLYVTIFYS